MSVHISQTIILRTWEFRERDLMVSFFTKDTGRLKGVAWGGRNSTRRFANSLDPFSLVSMEYELKRGRDLYILHSGKLIHGYPGIRSDFSCLSLASYMVELTETLFPAGVKAERMFILLRRVLSDLEGEKATNRIRVFFEMRAMALGGYGIDLDRCCLCRRTYAGEGRAVFLPDRGAIACLKCARESRGSPGLSPESVKALKTILGMPFAWIRNTVLHSELVREIRPVLDLHLEYRLGKRLRASRFLE